MEEVLKIINDFMPYIAIVMAVIIILLFILVIILFKSLGRVEKRFRRLMRGTNNKNLEELILSELDTIAESRENSERAIQANKDLEEKMKGCIQKTAIMRYKAFEDVGSDLSFSVALLDDNDDGVILTGIYGRQDSTTYAKPIDKGISRYDLSEEEVTVLNEAINK